MTRGQPANSNQAPETGRPISTAQDVHDAIAVIVNKQRTSAQRSEYDRKVCILAVATADAAFQAVRIEGTPRQYCGTVLSTLVGLQEAYNDPDGAFTNGRSEIGSIVGRVADLRRSLPE